MRLTTYINMMCSSVDAILYEDNVQFEFHFANECQYDDKRLPKTVFRKKMSFELRTVETNERK